MASKRQIIALADKLFNAGTTAAQKAAKNTSLKKDFYTYTSAPDWVRAGWEASAKYVLDNYTQKKKAK